MRSDFVIYVVYYSEKMCDFNGAIMQIHIKAVLYLHTYIWFNYIFFSICKLFLLVFHLLITSSLSETINLNSVIYSVNFLFSFKKREKKFRKTKSECSEDIHLNHQQKKNNKLNKLIDEFYYWNLEWFTSVAWIGKSNIKSCVVAIVVRRRQMRFKTKTYNSDTFRWANGNIAKVSRIELNTLRSACCLFDHQTYTEFYSDVKMDLKFTQKCLPL